jgi:hypothetical protein
MHETLAPTAGEDESEGVPRDKADETPMRDYMHGQISCRRSDPYTWETRFSKGRWPAAGTIVTPPSAARVKGV